MKSGFPVFYDMVKVRFEEQGWARAEPQKAGPRKSVAKEGMANHMSHKISLTKRNL